jgi:hypothetical protein
MTQEEIHDLNLKSGMLQSWNQLCFNKNAIYQVPVVLVVSGLVFGQWVILDEPLMVGLPRVSTPHLCRDPADVQVHGRKTTTGREDKD